MAFSWKKSLQTQLMRLKSRRHIYLKQGDNNGAKDLAYRIEKLEKVIKDGKA